MIRYFARRPTFPVICIIGRELIGAHTAPQLETRLAAISMDRTKLYDLFDATGDGWYIHPDMMVVSPLSFKTWTKKKIIDLFNLCPTAQAYGLIYSDRSLSAKRLAVIAAEIVAWLNDPQAAKRGRRRRGNGNRGAGRGRKAPVQSKGTGGVGSMGQVAIKTKEHNLTKALLEGGSLSNALFEWELEEHIDKYLASKHRDGDVCVVGVTERDNDVALLFIDTDDTVYRNQKARARLRAYWRDAYGPNMLKLIPEIARQLAAGYLFVAGVQEMRTGTLN